MSEPWVPNWTIHPGEILRETLEELHLSPRVAAIAMNVEEADLVAVLECRAPITAEMARRLAVFAVTERMWLALQRHHDEALARGAPNLSDGAPDTP